MNKDSRNLEGDILVIDDNSENLRILTNLLSELGYYVRPVPDGNMAISSALAMPPDLILLDIMMPEIDGFEVCQKLKEFTETRDIPVIFLTAKVETDDIVKGFKTGAADYVTKPFNFYELLARINTHLDLKRSKDIIMKQSREQKELLHVLCHDLINPFNGIISITDIFDDLDDAGKMEMIKNLNKIACSGIEVINLVRKMRALEEKRLEITGCDLKAALHDSIFMLGSRFAEKGIIHEILINDDKLNVCAEKTSLVNSVINNLCTNAIKFSFPDSKIYISAQKENDKVVLLIKDLGIGIPQNILNDIFDVTKTTSREGTKGETGTGFGMPLVKKFIIAYGGEIEINSIDKKESPDDHGTEVKVTLKAFSG
ncbi:MAG: hybrid sensor histidine kinase/response regulator [Desulfobacteraceae bacterium]|nr:hybrid sensor histidine kinase/response regulator [Desulfobacteraceae bacterium]